jgi:hypothetical protein
LETERDDFTYTGFIYVIWSPSLPEQVKIGESINVPQRVRPLNTPLVYRHQAVCIWAVNGHKKAEKVVHAALKDSHIDYGDAGKELFAINPSRELVIVEDGYGGYVEECIHHSEEIADYIDMVLYHAGFEYERAIGYEV